MISVLFLWWPNNKDTVQGTAGFGVLLLINYVGWAYRRFGGPRTLSTDEQLRREQALGEAHGAVAD